MSSRWCDGFGRYGGTVANMLNGSSSQAWAQVDTGVGKWNLSNANPRTGSWHLRLTGNGASPPYIARRVFGDPLTEVFFGHALYFEELPTTEPTVGSTPTGFWIAKFRDQANNPMLGVFLGTDGAIVLYRGGDASPISGNFTATLLGRSSPVVGTGAYMHFEHYVKIDDTTGAYELRVNEVTVLNLTSINTDNGGGEVSQVTIGREASPFSSGKNVDMEDCYVNDTTSDGSACDTFVGDCKCGILLPNGDTAQADFTKSTGTIGYQLIDETPPDDSDYIATASATAQSNFGLTDGPANLSEILTVRPFIRAKKDDAGTCLVRPSIIVAGDKAVVADQAVTTAFAYYDNNIPLSPDTGVPLTPSELNSMLEAIERTA